MAPPKKDDKGTTKKTKKAAAKKTKAKTKAKTKKAAPKKKSPLADVRAVANKVFPKDTSPFVPIDGSKMKKSLPHLPTGSVVIDFAIGGKANKHGVMPCPGFPRGKLVNLYGRESAGKTTLALTAAATTIQNGGSVCFIDWEYAVDLSYAEALGVPVEDADLFALVQPETLEKGIKILHVAAKRGIPLIVVDSVSAGVPETLYEQKLQDVGKTGKIGEVARIWSAYLPKLKSTISKTGSCVTGISQLRKKIQGGGFGGGGSDGDLTAGGEAWKYYSELRMGLRRVATEKGQVYDALTHKMVESPVGNTIKITIDKCKIAASQGRSAEFHIRYGKGIDDVRSVIDIATAHGVVRKSGSWFSWERPSGDTIRVQGSSAFRQAVEDADGAWPELYKGTLNKMLSGAETAIDIPPVVEDDLSELDSLFSGVGSEDESVE